MIRRLVAKSINSHILLHSVYKLIISSGDWLICERPSNHHQCSNIGFTSIEYLKRWLIICLKIANYTKDMQHNFSVKQYRSIIWSGQMSIRSYYIDRLQVLAKYKISHIQGTYGDSKLFMFWEWKYFQLFHQLEFSASILFLYSTCLNCVIAMPSYTAIDTVSLLRHTCLLEVIDGRFMISER